MSQVYDARPASRKQIDRLRQLTLSSAFSDSERDAFAAWAMGNPTAADAHGMIDRAIARVNDPAHREKASVAARLDSLSARIAYALDRKPRPASNPPSDALTGDALQEAVAALWPSE